VDRPTKLVVYVSSTFSDLQEHRQVLKQALEQSGYNVEAMERYPAFDERPLERCLDDVADCDFYVLLLAHRYGFRPEVDGKKTLSITEREYLHAGECGKPRLVFCVEERYPWPPNFIDYKRSKDGRSLAALRQRASSAHGVRTFTTPETLASAVQAALSEHQQRSPASDRGLLTPMAPGLAQLPDMLIAALEAKGFVGAGAQAIDRQTVIALARRLRPEESLDFDQALRELEHAVEVAREVLATGEHATSQDAFIDRVLLCVAEQTREGQLDVSADELDAALAEMERQEQAQKQRHRTLLEATIKQAVLLRDAGRATRAVLQLGTLDDPVRPAWSAVYQRQIETFMNEGEQQGLNFSLEIAIALAREQLDAATSSDERGEAGNRLGIALMRLGERESGMARLEEAVQVYRAVLQEYTRERMPLDWAMTQNNLGTALMRLGERESGMARLEEAVQVYRAVLQEYTRERVPLDWAMTQNNLGIALMRLGERESGTAHLEEAVQVYRAALQERTRERVPLDWAMTQTNLGVALMCLRERESGTARLEEAVQAYRAALQEYTRERVPLDWAMTQNNLGVALMRLGERESGTARLEEAVQVYRAALQEYTRERVPLDWAMTQTNLGIALRILGERENDTARLEEAVQAHRAALQERTRERVPLDWAMTQTNLGITLQVLGEHESGIARLEEAVQAYHTALQERTRERVPLDWAMTQANLGITLASLGERESGTARLEEAVQVYRAALQEYTQERIPLDWAGTQTNLGIALMRLGERESGTARLEEAVQAYRAALQEFTAEATPWYLEIARDNLQRALDLIEQRRSGLLQAPSQP
jgi:tetratricopeptide (TPR) repeat protein